MATKKVTSKKTTTKKAPPKKRVLENYTSNSNRGSKKGERRGGRQHGTPNLWTSQARDNVLAVFNELGGVHAMTDWARNNQETFYLRVFMRLLPQSQEAPMMPPRGNDGGDGEGGGGSAVPVMLYIPDNGRSSDD